MGCTLRHPNANARMQTIFFMPGQMVMLTIADVKIGSLQTDPTTEHPRRMESTAEHDLPLRDSGYWRSPRYGTMTLVLWLDTHSHFAPRST
jgi:hypothetical protein